MTTARIATVRYNAARRMHEARVDLIREDRTFRYPCEVPGPADIDAGLLQDALLAQALRMSDSPRL